MLGNNSSLSQGENSISLQNQGEIKGSINIGYSLSDIKDLFESFFSANLPALVEKAKAESYRTIADFALIFHDKLNSSVNDAVNKSVDEKMEEKFASSEIQQLIREVVNQVGTKTDTSLNDMLANMLIEKLNDNNNSYIINQSISHLKYLNKDQILFLCFIKHIRGNPVVTFTYNNEEITCSCFSMYDEINARVSSLTIRENIIEEAKKLYKDYINKMSNFFIKNISGPVDIDLLFLNNMIFFDKHYIETTLECFRKGMGVSDYKIENMKSDFPKLIEFLEFMKIDISNFDDAIKPLTPFGQCIADNCNIGIYKTN